MDCDQEKSYKELKQAILFRLEYNYMQHVVAHGRVVANSHQITEVKQRRARLVLGWVTGAWVTLPAMCRGVGQAFHYYAASVHPAVMSTLWKAKWRNVNGISRRKCTEFSPDEHQTPDNHKTI